MKYVLAMTVLLLAACAITDAPDTPVGCTQEAKVCPDGSVVSRGGPDCEFAQCPEVTTPPDSPVACTQEAKLCPDGSYVSRGGPNCEFAPCPT